MKPRELRRKAIIKARIRLGASWADVCILNISSRGLGLQCLNPPARGTYVEVRRGTQVIVARVAWASGHKFGVRTQDPLQVDQIIHKPDHSRSTALTATSTEPCFERRASPRTKDSRHEQSRHLSRAFEFTFLVILGVSSAFMIAGSLAQAFARPLARAATALNGADAQ